jgi:N6-L-threonylcarbamoyladenine synthase
VGQVRRLGATIDDAAGEAFDKIAKSLGLGYPGGPALERAAAGGDPDRFPLPRALLGRKDCDFSFSGLKTAAARIAQTLTADADRADLAAAVQAAIVRQLVERSGRAMEAWTEAVPAGADRAFVVAGGVAANRAVRTGLEQAAASRGFRFLAPPLAYCTDNAAMIALAGAERLALGLTSPLDVAARPRWPRPACASGSRRF